MTDFHPLTEKVIETHPNGQFGLDDLDREDFIQDLDEAIRDHLTPPTVIQESGVRFPDFPGTPIDVAGNFITSGNQMQMVIVGTEPVLVVQPEYDADENRVTLITTVVDLRPEGLVQVLESLLDGVREIVRIQEEASHEDA